MKLILPLLFACALSGSDEQWMQTAVAQWSRASASLGRPSGPSPWIVFYDRRCVRHVNAAEGAADRSQRYRQRFTLPNGQKLTAAPVAFGALSKRGVTFFVMALPSVWRTHPGAMPAEDIDAFATSVFVHEMTHTIHIHHIARAAERLEKTYAMPKDLDDDLLQKVFRDNPEYVRRYEEELELYRRAWSTRDDAEALRILREALVKSEERRSAFFTGPNAYFREVEPMFLNMEGVATWAAYSVMPKGADLEHVAGRWWSQEEGLVLFLLLDRFDPAWKTRVFGEDVPSPFAMLAEVKTRNAARESGVEGVSNSGGADGARTRDLRRDRPAF
jgi:hypothetical protein